MFTMLTLTSRLTLSGYKHVYNVNINIMPVPIRVLNMFTMLTLTSCLSLSGYKHVYNININITPVSIRV